MLDVLLPRPLRLLPAALLLCAGAPAWAQIQDNVKLNAGYALQSDSNLFRLPAGAALGALIGRPSAAEQIGISTLGFKLNQEFSLQRLELDLSLIDYRYQNFNYLSFTAQNYAAAWHWGLTPRLRGTLSSERKQTLNSYADFQGLQQRNQRSNRHTRFDATHELDGRWQVIGGAARASQTNQQALIAEGDYTMQSLELGLRRSFDSGSTLDYTRKNTSGNYLKRVLPSTGLFDSDFRQTDNELKAHWVISANSTASLSAAHIRRTHPHYPQRNYSGLNTGAHLNWSLSGKSALAAGWSRELASYQTSSSNYRQTERVYLDPSWQVSPKTLLRLRHEVAWRLYLDSPTGLATSQRRDTTRDTTLSFDWQPYPYVTLGVALQSARRDSNLAGLDYESRMATASAQFSF